MAQAQVGDLTSMAAVKAWLNNSNQAFPPNSDAVISSLITSASRFVRTYLSSPLVPANYSERYNGSGTNTIFLRTRPVVAVTSLYIGTTQIFITPDPGNTGFGQPGFMFDDTRVYLPCSYFPVGTLNVLVGYTAGFQAQTNISIDATKPFPVATLAGVTLSDGLPAGPWNSDQGVVLANGTSLVLSLTAPGPGQYQLTNGSDGTFQYIFNAAQQGQMATISYGHTPWDLSEATTELVGERMKVRGRIGEVSQHLGPNSTVSFSQKDMNDFIKSTFDVYKNVVPV